MATIIPTAPPHSFMRGDTVRWRIKSSDYPPSTHTVTVAFVRENDQRTIQASDNGDGTHLVELAIADSGEFVAGIYRWVAYAEDDPATPTERFQVDQGAIVVQENFAVGDGHDARSHAAVMFDAICALLQGKASHDQSNLSIGDRSLSKYPIDDLETWKGHYAWQMSEDEKIARGYQPQDTARVRFLR